jgi:DNA polymerase III delta subunit
VIYFLSGKDSFRKQIRLEELKKQYIEPGMESLSLNSINGKGYEVLETAIEAGEEITKPVFYNFQLSDFVSELKTPGMGFGKKVIIIKDFSYLEHKANKDSEIDLILETLNGLPENTILIFDSEKITGTIKLVKNIKTELESKTKFEDFTPFTNWNVKESSEWLSKTIPEFGRDNAEYLIEQLGTEDSSKLYSEAQRLLIINKKITREIIDRECEVKTDNFKFIKLLAQNKISEANQELKRIFLKREAHLGLLAMMETMLSTYLKLKLVQGKSKDQKAKILGINPGRLYHLEKEINSMQTTDLEKLLSKVLQAEQDIKYGRKQLEPALRYLVNS